MKKPNTTSLVPYLAIGPNITDNVEELICEKYATSPEATWNDYCNLCSIKPDHVEANVDADKKLVRLLEWEKTSLQDKLVNVAVAHPTSPEKDSEASQTIETLGSLASLAYMRSVIFVDECLFRSRGNVFDGCNDELSDEDIKHFFPSNQPNRISKDFHRYQMTSPALFCSLENRAVAETGLMVKEYRGKKGPFILPEEFDKSIEKTIKQKFMRLGYIFMKREEITFNPNGLFETPDFE